MKKIYIFIFLLFISIDVFSQETLTITTYYPAPIGIYQELRATRMAIGDNYINNAQHCWPPEACVSPIDAAADLVVEGRTGIGTVNPQRMLHVLSNDGFLARIETNPTALAAIDSAVLEIKNNSNQATTHRAVNFLDRWDYPVGQIAFNGNHPLGTSMWIHVTRPNDARLAPYADLVLDANGNLGLGTITPQARLDVAGDAVLVPRNTDNPTGVNGMIYYNTTNNEFRGYQNGEWKVLGTKTLHMAKLARSAAQNIPSGGTNKILLNSEEFDYGGIANPGSGSFVIAQSGLYEITASWRCGAFALSHIATGDSELSVYIYRNGAEVLHAGSSVKGPINESGFVLGSDVMYLNQNDIIEMYVSHTAGGSRPTMTAYTDRPRMSVIQIR
ncbi:MAG: hypothetical protein WC546_00215 [Candidatus Omnitrophota bacterium]